MKPTILAGIAAGLFLLVAATLFGPEAATALFQSLTGIGETP